MTVLITVSSSSASSGPLYDLYSNINYVTPLASGVTKSALTAGYSLSGVPDAAITIRITSTGPTCTNSIDVTITGGTTTTTTSSTTASTCPDCILGLPVLIGTQEWTNCNLDVTTYANGDTIPQVTDPTAWAALTTGAWCYYDNNSANGTTYGKMYNWYAVTDPRGLAPTGYHIPTLVEFDTLITFLGGETVAGGKLKETGLCNWLTPNTGATNESSFTGLPGGYRDNNGVFGEISNYGLWWSSVETVTAFANYLLLGYNNSNAFIYVNSKTFGFSVRLIKDDIT